jgi:hypothetical protein
MGKIHRPDVVSHQQNLWIKVISSTPYHKGGWGGGIYSGSSHWFYGDM